VGVWRRWVFPILSIVVLGAISLALVKLAFFPDVSSAEAIEPSGALAAPHVTVEKGSVVSEIPVAGTVARDDDVVLKSEATGTVTGIPVAQGKRVKAGHAVLDVKLDYPVKTVPVTAPVTGEVATLTVVKGQQISIGEEVGTVRPDSHHITGTVEPSMLYRLLDAPAEATATIQGGPAPFVCDRLRLSVGDDGVASVNCRVPADVTVFAGLPVALAIAAGTSEDVLTIPVTAVKGGAGTGVVWVAGESGEPEERDVTLGLSDGVMVEVTGGLAEGDTVLEFVPGLENQQGEESCWIEPDGSEVCELVQW
jgi:membrane fusion protein, macrolide-specific efflux system